MYAIRSYYDPHDLDVTAVERAEHLHRVVSRSRRDPLDGLGMEWQQIAVPRDPDHAEDFQRIARERGASYRCINPDSAVV